MIALLILILSGYLSAQISQWEKQLEADPDNTELLLNLGKAYHDLAGVEEDEDAVQQAESYLSRLMKIDPQNAVALVYYGSVLTMKARDAFLPWEKMKYMRKGFATMDSAVALDPHSPEVRLIRANNGTSVPKMFHRLKIALADFQFIESLDKEKLAEMTNKFWLPYYYYFGRALVKDEQFEAAEVKFAKVIAIDSDSEYAKNARQQLEKMKK
jgi:tetratricopeptide (TPR) repeat protein